jgi:hypothetical protein
MVLFGFPKWTFSILRVTLGRGESVATAAWVDFVTSERNERPSVAFGHLTAAQIRAAVLARGAFLSEFEPHNPGEKILFVRRGVGQAPE